MSALHACILVLEDSETSRFVIREVLERAGFACLEAETPDQALRLLGERTVDLLLADAMLRGADGIEAARELRRRAPGLPVLYVSGFPLEHLRERGLLVGDEFASGSAAFLQKPFLPDALLGTVRLLLAQARRGG